MAAQQPTAVNLANSSHWTGALDHAVDAFWSIFGGLLETTHRVCAPGFESEILAY